MEAVSELVSNTRKFVDELEQYRAPWESKSHWYARKTFLRHNWDSTDDKERLICLSTAWANVNFMQNRYPAKVMQQLREMENGMDDAHTLLRESEKQVTGDCIDFSTVKTMHLPKNVHRLPPGMAAVRFVKNSHNMAVSDGAPVSKESGDTSQPQKTIVECTDSSDIKSQNDMLASTSQYSCDISAASYSSGSHLTKEIPRSLLTSSDNSTDVKKQPYISKPHLPVKRTSDQITENTMAAKRQPKKPYIYKVLNKPSHQPNTIVPTEEQRSTIKHLARLLKEQINMFSPEIAVKMLTNCCQTLKCNPVFQYSRLKQTDLPLYSTWATRFNVPVDIREGMFMCDIFVKNIFIAHGHGPNKVQAQRFAATGTFDLFTTLPVYIVRAQRQNGDHGLIDQLAVSCEETSRKDLLPPLCENAQSGQSSDSHCSFNTEEQRVLLKNFVVRERSGDSENSISVLNQSAQFSHVPFDYTFSMLLQNKSAAWKCTVELCHQEFASAIAPNQKEAKLAAAQSALKILKQFCPTILIESDNQGNMEEALSRQDILSSNSSVHGSIGPKISEENVGNQLLRKMGYTGGGLGKLGDGISDPVSVTEACGKAGLGTVSADERKLISFKDASKVLREYVDGGSEDELTFSSELTSDERKTIHAIAGRFGLASRSYGKGEQRHLVVYRKKTASALVNELRKAGGQKKGFHLVDPKCRTIT